jgi:hypothetical protein
MLASFGKAPSNRINGDMVSNVGTARGVCQCVLAIEETDTPCLAVLFKVCDGLLAIVGGRESGDAGGAGELSEAATAGAG